MSDEQDTAVICVGNLATAELDAIGHLELVWCAPPSLAGGVPLIRTRMVLGRGEQCAIRLSDSAVSRAHAEIAQHGGTMTIRDLGSTNGTFVDGQRIAVAELHPGQILRFGSSVGMIAYSSSVDNHPPFGSIAPDLLGGRRLKEVLLPARRAARSALPILIVGESGVGKERIARAVHLWSGRAGPFVGVNCAAIPPELAEGELFGYRRGAFTGAVEANIGQIRASNGGTLLLDEMADLPLALQGKLLRVLEEREVPTLGRPRPVAVDFRVVATAQTALSARVAKGKFRGDLYARLRGLVISVPPLRERREDIIPLFLHFYERATSGVVAELDVEVVERLCSHDFPMNVRELKLVAEQVAALHGARVRLQLHHLAGCLGETGPRKDREAAGPAAKKRATGPVNRKLARDHHELSELRVQLAKHGGNVLRAALSTGISRQRAYRLLRNSSTAGQSPTRPERVGDEPSMH